MIDYEVLSKIFRRFGIKECRGSSALYERLSISIAEDEQILAIAEYCPQGQPVPNLLLAAVQYLLLQDQNTPLARFYRSLTDDPLPPDGAYAPFREFCLQNATVIEHLLTTRLVQTNEVRRTTYLYLAFSMISRLVEQRPLALIEIGASAGLNLLCDKFGYHYGEFGQFGDRQSLVQLECELRGDKYPPLPGSNLKVAYRVGLDLNPIDVKNDEQVLWLTALIWPEHVERATLLRRAIEIAKKNPPVLLKGNAIELLPAAIRAVPEDAAVCVFHTFTINQFSPGERERFSIVLADLAPTRDSFFRVSVEELSTPNPKLELTSWLNRWNDHRELAYCHAHGQWIEWLDDRD